MIDRDLWTLPFFPRGITNSPSESLTGVSSCHHKELLLGHWCYYPCLTQGKTEAHGGGWGGLPKDVTQLAGESKGFSRLHGSGRKSGWQGRRRPSWRGLVRGKGREGPPTAPDVLVTDFARRLPPARPLLLPPWPGSPVGSLWAAGALVLTAACQLVP